MKQKTLFRPQYWKIWTIISDHPKIEPFDEKVYAAIDWFHGMKDGECRASNATIATLIKPTDPQPRSVQNSLNRLESCGFIRREYKDTAKRNRIRITPLISPMLERTTGDRQETSETVMIDERNGDDRHERNGDDQSKNKSSKNISKNITCEPSSQVAEFIYLFKPINPTISYGNKTIRKAAEDLITQFGFDLAKRYAEHAVAAYGKPYAPVITTPWELKEKLSRLGSFYASKKGSTLTMDESDMLESLRFVTK